MKGPRHPGNGASSDGRSPWLKGTDVEGVIPPGRRLGDAHQKRTSRWSAAGVHGVTPPGRPADSPASRWSSGQGKRSKTRSKQAPPPDVMASRGRHAFTSAIFDDAHDPDDLAAFLEELSRFVGERRPRPELAESFRDLIIQSRAPYEIVVAFTILSSIVGSNAALRRRYALALERGAKAFYNLAYRLNKSVSLPRGLAPETLDPLFFDLPELSYEVPYAYAVDAFCQQIELLREEGEGSKRDQALVAEARRLRARFIERRTYGDRPLRDLFPWDDADGHDPGP